MDLVITAAPSEEVKRAIECAGLSSAFTVDDLSGYQQSLLENYRLDSLERFFESDSTGQQWRAEPLLIPDNVENQWYRTHFHKGFFRAPCPGAIDKPLKAFRCM